MSHTFDMEQGSGEALSFWERLRLAFGLIFSAKVTRRVGAGIRLLEAEATERETAPERQHASALALLSMFQREGRFLDFLEQEVTGYSDAEVGAAARVVHEGCRQVVNRYLKLEPVFQDSEGDSVTVPRGFDSQRIRLTGNVAGRPPFKGTLSHPGWVAKEVRFPKVEASLDPGVLAPAEVEL